MTETIALILFALFFMYILFPWGVKIYIRKNFLNKMNQNGSVCLTYDDGPNPYSTPKILELLEKADIKATFFVLGVNAKKYPDIVKR